MGQLTGETAAELGEMTITPGQRFKPAGMSIFGHAPRMVFEVRGVMVDSCDHPHARLVGVDDPMDQRLIAVHALKDRKLFVPIRD